MVPFPELDLGGVAYRVNLWSDLLGGVPITIGAPARPDIDRQAIEEEILTMAQALATRLGATITSIVLHESTSEELSLAAPPEAP